MKNCWRAWGPSGQTPKKGEGLNLPDQVCPGCVQRCVQTCARNTREDHRGRRLIKVCREARKYQFASVCMLGGVQAEPLA